MSRDRNDGKSSNDAPTIQDKTQSLSDKLDLDKNPLQFGTHEPGKFSTEAHDKDYMELTLRSGKHSDLVKKLLRQRIETRAKEFPRWPGDLATGVRTMWIESRFWYDRERLSPDFDDDWRQYRARYLHSLELHPSEPVHVPEYETALLNPIRRFYMKGGDWLEDKIIKKFTRDKWQSAQYRVSVTRGIMIYFALMAGYYWIRYNHRTWTAMGGPNLYVSSPIMYPSHPKYPFEDFRKEPAHHYDIGFTRRTIFKDLRDYEDSTVVL